MITGRVLYLHGFASGPDSAKARILKARFAEAGIRLEVPNLNGGNIERLSITGQLEVAARAAGARRYLETIGPDQAQQWERAPEVPQPVRILHGIRDGVVPPGPSQEFVRRHPHARLERVDHDHSMLPDAGMVYSFPDFWP